MRDVERAILSLPPEYKNAQEPDSGGDVKDYPRIAKLQSDLLVHALASGQTRVASYMLTKRQSLVRPPWPGYTTLRRHDYTHTNADIRPAADPAQLCRWHVEEFAYLIGKRNRYRKVTARSSTTAVCSTCHEHAEANPHKNNGLAAIVAGHAGNLVTGRHTKVTGTMGVFLTLANGPM